MLTLLVIVVRFRRSLLLVFGHWLNGRIKKHDFCIYLSNTHIPIHTHFSYFILITLLFIICIVWGNPNVNARFNASSELFCQGSVDVNGERPHA